MSQCLSVSYPYTNSFIVKWARMKLVLHIENSISSKDIDKSQSWWVLAHLGDHIVSPTNQKTLRTHLLPYHVGVVHRNDDLTPTNEN